MVITTRVGSTTEHVSFDRMTILDSTIWLRSTVSSSKATTKGGDGREEEYIFDGGYEIHLI
jgi:hypothetical protein